MLSLTKDNFEKEVVKNPSSIIVDFFGTYCGPCKLLEPVYEKISKEYAGKLRFAKVCADDNPDLSVDHSVFSVPCMILYHQGKEVDRIVGYSGEETLKKKINEILARAK